MSRSRAFQAVLAAFLLSWCTGCATSVPTDQPCESDSDCAAGEVCDQELMQCARAAIRTNNGEPPITTNNDGDTPDMGSDPIDTSTPGDDADVVVEPDAGGDMTTPVECEPACGANEVCAEGQCVSACMPACTAPEICGADGCTLPDCTAAGDPCDPARPEQGAFGCATDGSGGDGVCLAKCPEAYRAEGCEVGEYCWEAGSLSVCVPSSCATDTDCTGGGNCIGLDNQFSICFQAGSVPLGGACDPSAADCVRGSLCRATSTTTGVCSAICDQFAADPGCPGTELCAYQFTPLTSLCTSNIDPRGDAPYYVCDNPGAACDDATMCFDVGTENACLKYCRPGTADCNGIVDGLGNPAICDNYVFPGIRDVGICFSQCGSDTDCGTAGKCVQDVCRLACTTDVDCCNGTTPCDFSCTAGLCE